MADTVPNRRLDWTFVQARRACWHSGDSERVHSWAPVPAASQQLHPWLNCSFCCWACARSTEEHGGERVVCPPGIRGTVSCCLTKGTLARVPGIPTFGGNRKLISSSYSVDTWLLFCHRVRHSLMRRTNSANRCAQRALTGRKGSLILDSDGHTPRRLYLVV